MRATALLALLALLAAGCASAPAEPSRPRPDASVAPEGPASTLPAVPAVPHWGPEANATIRPGSPAPGCTYNFLFFAPANGTYYIGTAAHCTEIGERMALDGKEIGAVVYDSDDATGASWNGPPEPYPHADFSLVRLLDGLNLQAHPKVVNRAGPTGVATDGDVAPGDIVQYHGYGLVVGDFERTRDRDGVLTSFGDMYCTVAPDWWGDSGGPILHQETGKAVSIVNRFGVDCAGPPSTSAGSTVGYILRELAEHGWSGVQLATV